MPAEEKKPKPTPAVSKTLKKRKTTAKPAHPYSSDVLIGLQIPISHIVKITDLMK